MLEAQARFVESVDAVRSGLALFGITLQTTLQNGIVISDVPGPTGGILIQTTTGAMISVSDVGIGFWISGDEAWIALYRALGGGWERPEEAPATARRD